MIIISCLSCLTRVGLNRCLCKVHVQVLYILTCRKKITAPFADGAMRALGVSTAPVRTAIYGPGVWPCVSLSFLYKINFRHVINLVSVCLRGVPQGGLISCGFCKSKDKMAPVKMAPAIMVPIFAIYIRMGRSKWPQFEKKT